MMSINQLNTKEITHGILGSFLGFSGVNYSPLTNHANLKLLVFLEVQFFLEILIFLRILIFLEILVFLNILFAAPN